MYFKKAVSKRQPFLFSENKKTIQSMILFGLKTEFPVSCH